MAIDADVSSSYLTLLPSIYSDGAFVGRLLLAFEHVLSGLPGVTGAEPDPLDRTRVLRGLEEIIDDIPALLDPNGPYVEFLPWLADWVAMSMRADLSIDDQKRLLARIVPLYRTRGTLDNLKDLLHTYTGHVPAITEGDPAGEARPYHFNVALYMNPSLAEVARFYPIATALIDLQKPAHTTYTLTFEYQAMQIGPKLQLGVNTFMGTVAPTPAPTT